MGERNKSRGDGMLSVRVTGTESRRFLKGVEDIVVANLEDGVCSPLDGVDVGFVIVSCTRSRANSRSSSSS